MIDLCISGTLDQDTVIFSINGESKAVDQFSKQAHFRLEENKTYRIGFEQVSSNDIPRFAEIILDILFLPVRGVFNILMFNNDRNWEEDISAFKLSGYIDVNINKDAEISFELRRGKFNKSINKFQSPVIVFSHDALIEQSCYPDSKEVTQKHLKYLLNIASVGVWLFALLFYLIFIGLRNKIYSAVVIVSALAISFGILIAYLIFYSFKEKRSLLTILAKQHNDQN